MSGNIGKRLIFCLPLSKIIASICITAYFCLHYIRFGRIVLNSDLYYVIGTVFTACFAITLLVVGLLQMRYYWSGKLRRRRNSPVKGARLMVLYRVIMSYSVLSFSFFFFLPRTTYRGGTGKIWKHSAGPSPPGGVKRRVEVSSSSRAP